MVNKWIISDTHFGHTNIIRFETDGELIRPGYTTDDNSFVSFLGQDIAVHDEALIQRWNERVNPGDKVYHLGDFGKPLDIVKRLNGRKRLILGNHDDIHDAQMLGKVFEKVLSWRVFNKEFALPTVFCHYPLHRSIDDPVPRRVCVHGHIHEKTIRGINGRRDPWYLNVCVEHTNMAPLSFDELGNMIRRRKYEIDNVLY